MKKKPAAVLMLLCCMAQFSFAQQADSTKKKSNYLSVALQPTVYRLNIYDPNFFNNPRFRMGVDLSFLYGRNIGKTLVNRAGIDYVLNQGKFIVGQNRDTTFINESFIRIPEMIVQKFSIECSNCILNPVFFVEAGGYVSISAAQTTYREDTPTGQSSLDKSIYFGYMKGGLMGGIGLSFLSNNFGRHVFGFRFYSDRWLISEFKSTGFKPNYSSFNIYYNIANIRW